jgi:hypothetical protein
MKRRTATQLGNEGDVPDPRPLQPFKGQAPVARLSATDRRALIECLRNSVLRKISGFWHGSAGCKPISGNTVANLGRDGLMTVTKTLDHGSAKLTERGQWFAQTLIGRSTG